MSFSEQYSCDGDGDGCGEASIIWIAYLALVYFVYPQQEAKTSKDPSKQPPKSGPEGP